MTAAAPAGQAARAAPDGHTVLCVFGSFEISPTLSKISCDPRRDFAPVTLAVTTPTVLVVNPVVTAQSFR
jgi:tripartite-type tricarboxylate transporter receptor subunit TctC